MTDTIGRCRDCKYWTRSSNNWGHCSLAATINHKPAHPDGGKLLLACDDEIYGAYLITSPDFGCVAFVAKEKA